MLTTHFRKFLMATTAQHIVWSTLSLVLGWCFRGRQIQWHYFRLDQIQDGGWRPFWKTSKGHISVTWRPIHFRFRSRVGFSRSPDWVALFLIGLNPRWRPAPFWRTSSGHISNPLQWSTLCLVSGWSFRVDRDGYWWPFWKKNSNDNALSDSLFVCTQTILCPQTL